MHIVHVVMNEDVIVPSHQTWPPYRYQSIGDLRNCEKAELEVTIYYLVISRRLSHKRSYNDWRVS